jgi:uncharacterized repeat protein (TIGR02543 family)
MIASDAEVTLFAQWSINSYDVTYAGNGSTGGTAPAVQTQNYNSTVTVPGASTLVRTGYLFVEWNTAADGSGTAYAQDDTFTLDASNVDLFAQWVAETYIVTFDSQGGSDVSTDSFRIDEPEITLPDAPERAGYTFTGWWSASTAGSLLGLGGATFSVPGNADVTYYAQWTLNTYSVNYEEQGGSVVSNTTYTVVSPSITLPAAPTRSGYTFLGWFEAESGGIRLGSSSDGYSSYTTTTSADISIYAQWSADTYTVNYNSAEGSTVANGSYSLGEVITLPATPTRVGYIFNGWYNAATAGTRLGDAGAEYQTTGTGPITIHAQWTIATYNVAFDSQGGSSAESTTYTIGGSINLPADPVRDGKVFDGWFAASSGGSRLGVAPTYSTYSPSATGDITLFAQWSDASYEITFNTGGGSSVSSSTYTTGGSIILPAAPSRTGYTFAGWYSAANDGTRLGNALQSITPGGFGPLSIYAQWTPITYSVTYEEQGGSSVTDSTYSVDQSTITLPSTPTQTGYTFTGWFTSSSGGTRAGDAGGSYAITGVGNVTIYAQWSANSYLVQYDSQGGSAASNANYTVVARSVTLPATPTRTGYTFTGWWSASTAGSLLGLGGATYSPSGTGDITIFAQWTLNTYNVNYEEQGGSVVSNATYTVVSPSITLPAAPTRSGYTFLGWFSASTEGAIVGGSSEALTINGAADVTYYAQWSANTYSVSYNEQGGLAVDDTTFTSVSRSITLPAATRLGYVFQGWFTSSTGGTRIGGAGNSYAVTDSSNVTYFAQWSAVSYTVTYEEQGGSSVADSTYTVDSSTITLPAAPVRDGFTFTGWFSAQTGGILLGDALGTATISGASNQVIYARWVEGREVPVLIGFNDRTVRVDAGNLAIIAPIADIPGTFTYVSNNSAVAAVVDGEIQIRTVGVATITATFTPTNLNRYQVTTINMVVTVTPLSLLPVTLSNFNDETISLNFNYRVNFPESNIPGTFTFTSNDTSIGVIGERWTYGQILIPQRVGCVKVTATFTPSVRGYAEASISKWICIIDRYNVVFDEQGGSAVSDTSFTLAAPTFVLPEAPSRTGYTFNGWFTSSVGGVRAGGASENYSPTVNVDMTVFAQWSPIVYTIGFEEQGGASVSNSTYTIGSSITLPIAPARAGYTFNGWFLSSTGGSTIGGSGATYFPTGTGNLSIFAQWTIQTYEISYISQGGSQTADAYYTVAAPAVTLPVAPTYAGYTFNGWYTSATGGTRIGGAGSSYTITGTGDKSYFAQWTLITYTVNFAQQGGSPVSSTTYTVASGPLTLPAAPIRPGYSFNGWYSANTGGTRLGGAGDPFTPSGTGDLNISAQWSASTYSVIYLDNSTTLSTVTYLTDGVVTLPAGPAKTGYNFDGWYSANTGGSLIGVSSSSYLPGYGNKNIFARYSLVAPYVVTFNTQGGSAAANNSYTVESRTITLPAAPTRAGYSFNGWFLAASGGSSIGSGGASYTFIGTGNVTIHAQWTIITFAVSYDVQGGSTPIANSSYTIGTSVSLPSPGTKANFIFNGWFTAATGGTRIGCTTYPCSYSPSGVGNITVYAQWIGSEIMVQTYPGVDLVELPSLSTFRVGTSFTLPSVSARPGYEFLGWYSASSGGTRYGAAGASINPLWTTGPESIFGQYRAISYTITTGEEGGSSVPNLTYTILAPSVTLPTTTRSGYTLNGWYTASSGGTRIGSAGATYSVIGIGNVTYYAQWTQLPPPEPTQSIRFRNLSGREVSVSYTASGAGRTITCPALPGNAPSGYTFVGWYNLSENFGLSGNGGGDLVCQAGQSWRVAFGPLPRPFPPTMSGLKGSGTDFTSFRGGMVQARFVRN